MQIHRKQYVIGSQKFLANENWKTYQIDQTIWLSCCPDLKVTKAKDNNDKEWYILGLAIETFEEKLSIEKEIERTNSDLVPSLSQSWTGRWILVGDGQLHLDASGLISCFYGQDSTGQTWASSSAAILSQIIFGDTPIVDSRKLTYEMGISWYVPPRSRFQGISRLLPCQIINLRSGEIQPRPLMPEIPVHREYEDILEEIQRILITTLQRLAEITPDLWLGLTAGYDSRSMLALSYAADVPIQPFTRISTRMSVADFILPPLLSEEYNFTHTFFKSPERRYSERSKLADEHTGGHVSSGDAKPFIKGVRDQMTGISIGGHGYAIATGFASLPTLPQHLDNAQIGAEAIGALFQEPKNSTATEGLKEWLEWIISHPQENLNWRDRFYLEQRQGGWLSSKEQLYDLNDLNRFPILNSAYLYSLFLAVKKERRLNAEIQKDSIANTAPKLMQYPFNPKDIYFNPLDIIRSKRENLLEYLLGNIWKKARYIGKSLKI